MTSVRAVKILRTERQTIGNVPAWVIHQDVTTDAGLIRHVQAIPESTFEWRVAEYGVDPTDLQTLIDIAVHEPHLPAGWDQGADFLYRAPDRATARAAHLARIAACKQALGTNSTLPRTHDPANPHPLHDLAASIVIDPARVAEKHNAVALQRGEPGARPPVNQPPPVAEPVLPLRMGPHG